MTDREKVIRGLECCSKGDCADCDNCTYHGVQTDVPCESTLMRDVLALLKAQEPVEPVIETTYGTAECDDPWGRLIFCGACGKRINEKYNPDEDDKYCKHCGKPVKWE